jgi:UDP-N-acetyl-D-mannosaminuronate dehydrogenase
MKMIEDLMNNIKGRLTVLGVIGLGYVEFPLAREFLD